MERVPSGLSLSGAREGVLLEGLGDRVGRLVYPGSVGQQLLEMVGGLGTARSLTLSVAVDSGLGEVAVEAARLPDGMVPARHPGVRMNRLIPGPVVMPVPSPGPLKILVAVGTPDEGQTPSVALDREAEIGGILDAVGATVGAGRAEVEVLEVANATTMSAALRKAVTRGGFHVLHLSGHGSATSIELETEDGAALPTTAADLVAAVQAAGVQVPLVFVSACHGATGDAGLATALIEAGVSRVVAMQSAVTDGYATVLAAAFYDRLAGPALGDGQSAVTGTVATPTEALAHARRVAGVMLRQSVGDRAVDEWPAATLLVSGADGPLIDPDLVPVRLHDHHVTGGGGGGVLPVLGEAGLIGRRREIRTAIRALRSGRAVALTGIGGIGKSSIAGRLAGRLTNEGWVVSTDPRVVGPERGVHPTANRSCPVVVPVGGTAGRPVGPIAGRR